LTSMSKVAFARQSASVISSNNLPVPPAAFVSNVWHVPIVDVNPSQSLNSAGNWEPHTGAAAKARATMSFMISGAWLLICLRANRFSTIASRFALCCGAS
jgi:hypothetical protein